MRAIIKAVLLLLCIFAFALPVAFLRLFGPSTARLRWRMIRACRSGMLAIIGLRYRLVGEASARRPLLLVTNHSTYLDILILGSALPVRFTPKADIAGWPVIGWLCRISDCVFIDRNTRATRGNVDALRQALNEGSMVCLFPEGTTSDGKRVLPFRSSYFSLAGEDFGGRGLHIQPAAIRYTHVCNLPIDTAQRHKIAWYGDMELVPHAAELLALGQIRAEVVFLPPVDASAFPDRKALAEHCRKAIAQTLELQ